MTLAQEKIVEEKIPEISELTSRQREAAAHNPINGNLYVSGPPGSGKTVILLRRGLFLKNLKNLRVLVLVYNRTLRKYISELKNFDSMEVETWYRWIYDRYNRRPPQFRPFEYDWAKILDKEQNSPVEYDVIMVDEGQDLPIELYKVLVKISRHLSVFADFNQEINTNNSTTESEITSLLEKNGKIKHVNLTENFRNPQSIHNFAEKYLVKSPEEKTICMNPIKGDPPTLSFTLSESEQLARLKNYLEGNKNKKVGIFVWWKSDVDYYYNKLKQIVNSSVTIQRYHTDLPRDEKNSISFNKTGAYVLAMPSVKGLQFDTVFMPQFTGAKVPDIDESLCRQKVYVAVTRPIEELHIFSSEPVPEVLQVMKKEKTLRKIAGKAPTGWEALKQEEELLF